MRQYPISKLIIPFVLGIFTASKIRMQIAPLLLVCGILLVVMYLLFLAKDNNYRTLISAAVIYISVFFIGAVHLSLSEDHKADYPFKNELIRKANVYGEIVQFQLPRKNKLSLIIKTDSVCTDSGNFRGNIHVLCNLTFKSDSKVDKFLDSSRIGNKISITGTFTKPRGERNPGEFNYAEYLNNKNIFALLNSRDDRKITIIDKNEFLIPNVIFNLRRIINDELKSNYPGRAASLMKGLLLADRKEIDYETREKFVNSGVVHVLAVSGLHVGYIVLIFIILSSRFNLYFRSVLTICGLIFFLIITGAPPSVFRATLMALIIILSFMFNRSTNGLNSLALAAFILLIINPGELMNPGFQLSFSAVLSIVLIYPVFRSKVSELPIKNGSLKNVLLFGGVTLAAQIGTLPFTLFYFHKLSVISLAANIIVIPLIGVIVAVGILNLLLVFTWGWIAAVYASANTLFIDGLYAIINFSGGQKFSYLYIKEFSFYDAVIFYFVLFCIYIFWKYLHSTKAKLLTALLILINLYIYLPMDNTDLMPTGKLSVMSIDIGQGDSFLIKFPNGKTALIDAGNSTPGFDNGMRVIKPLLQNSGISKIDYGFITHIDADHYRGYLSLITHDYVSKIFKPKIDTALSKDRKLESLIREFNVPVEYYHKSELAIGNCRLYILNDTSRINYNACSENDKSGIVKLVYGNTSFLFVGDASIKAEEKLVDYYDGFLHSDVLKVGHHGSKTSSSNLFLSAVSPAFAVISAGVGNKFKHPAPFVLRKLLQRNIRISRTDKSGAILYRSDGETIRVVNWKEKEL